MIRLLWLETTISRDEGAFGLIAMMWTRGTLPTYWLNDEGPLVYVIYAMMIYLFGNSIIPIRLLNDLLFIGSCLGVYAISSDWFGKRIGLMSLLFYGVSMNVAILEAMTALTEPLSTPFAIFSLYLVNIYRKKNRRSYLVLSGLLMSAAAFIRVTYVVGFLLLVIILIYDTRLKHPGHKPAIGSLIIGASIPLFIFLSYFGIQRDLYGLVEMYFHIASTVVYTDVPLFIKYLITVENLPIWVFSVVGVLVATKLRSQNHRFLLLWAFLFFFVSLVPPTFGHRMILLLPAACILAAIGFDSMVNRLRNTRSRNVSFFVAILLLILLFVPSIFYQSKQYPQLNLSYDGMQWAYADTDYNTQIMVSQYLKSHMSPNDSLFVHAWSAETYWLAGKAPPTKYVWSYGLLPEGELNRLTGLVRNTTFRYIVVFSPSYQELFVRAQFNDPIVRDFFYYYHLEKNIGNAYIFSEYDNSSGRTVYSFIDSFGNSSKYYDLGNGTFGETDNLPPVFNPSIIVTSINGEWRYAIEQVPLNQPPESSVVDSYISYEVHIPQNSSLNFGIGIDQNFWDKAHDTRFQVYVENDSGMHIVFDRTINPNIGTSDQWIDQKVDLSEFANQDVKIVFATSPGPSRNNSYSFALWSNPVIVAYDQTIS
jgi:hypothetical protein